MSAGVTFERVYHALKDQLGSGRYAAGEHLEPAALSRDLNASITPVRDALHRLTGEGLVETPRGEGFRVPSVTEIGLRHLYRWNAALLDLALRTRASHAPAAAPPRDSAPGTLERTETLFLAVAALAGNPEHAAALARLNDRLRPVRHAELGLIDDLEVELDELALRLGYETTLPLRRALAAFHRRRERLVDELVAALHAPR
jgi:DNA-binding transcriptional MocR family regulator